ncbi:MAG TPA: hypothetical protein VLB04_08875 [Methanotrichaceae archaeon]|nr:hypothetical protein [Methanotrichaceae archaeon]
MLTKVDKMRQIQDMLLLSDEGGRRIVDRFTGHVSPEDIALFHES